MAQQRRSLSSIVCALPQLSPTHAAGRVTKWLVAEGDTVSACDLIAHINADDVFDASAGGITGRVTMLLEAHDDGVVAEILVAEGGQDVPAGTPLALIADDGDGVDALRRAYREAPATGDAEALAARLGARVMAWQAYLHDDAAPSD